MNEHGVVLASGIRALPVAYLCLGHVRDLYDAPELQVRGWADRLSLSDLVFTDRWGGPATDP